MDDARIIDAAELCDMDPIRIEVSQAMRFTMGSEGESADEAAEGPGLSLVRVLSIYERVTTHGPKGANQRWKPVVKNLTFDDHDVTTAQLLRRFADYLDS